MIVQQHGRAMGTDIALTVRAARETEAETILRAMRNFLESFEARFSRFQPQSELSQVNARAGEACAASPEFLALAQRASAMAESTDGLYDPLLLPELQRAGYVGSWPQPAVRGATPDYRLRNATLATKLMCTDTTVTVPARTALDFGGIGKGYALDELAEIAERRGCTNYWISLGGDVIGRGTDESGVPWRVRLDELHDGTGTDAFATLSQTRRTAVATSSRMKRQGDGWHHIIDPRTKKPADTPIECVSVEAPSGLEADVLAKCILIAGNDARQFWQKHRQTAAYVQYAEHWERFD